MAPPRCGLSALTEALLAPCTGVGVLGGQLYAAGGHDGPMVWKSVEVFEPLTNRWRRVCDMNMCRRNAGWIVTHSLAHSLTDWTVLNTLM